MDGWERESREDHRVGEPSRGEKADFFYFELHCSGSPRDGSATPSRDRRPTQTYQLHQSVSVYVRIGNAHADTRTAQ